MKNLGCIRGSWEAVKDILFIEQILAEPGTMICMEDTVVIPRDSPSPYGAWTLVMETDTEQIQNVKIRHKSEQVIINLENIK